MPNDPSVPAEPLTYQCGGCGATSTDGMPACVRGAAAHQPPAPGFPLAEWLAYAEAAHTAHPVHGAFLAALKTPPAPAVSAPAAPVMRPLPTETCPKCGAALLPPADFPYCRACGTPLPLRRRR